MSKEVGAGGRFDIFLHPDMKHRMSKECCRFFVLWESNSFIHIQLCIQFNVNNRQNLSLCLSLCSLRPSAKHSFVFSEYWNG